MRFLWALQSWVLYLRPTEHYLGELPTSKHKNWVNEGVQIYSMRSQKTQRDGSVLEGSFGSPIIPITAAGTHKKVCFTEDSQWSDYIWTQHIAIPKYFKKCWQQVWLLRWQSKEASTKLPFCTLGDISFFKVALHWFPKFLFSKTT